MIDKVIATGELEEIEGPSRFGRNGTIEFESLAYVVTSSYEQISTGQRSVSASKWGGTIQFNSGSALVYDLNPVVIGAVGSMFEFVHGSVRFYNYLPVAFDDFAIYEDFTEPVNDPIDGIVLAGNEATMSGGALQPWVRHYKVFIPPKRARFIAIGARMNGMPSGGIQYIDSAQVEILSPGATVPTAYTPAREIKCKVRPTRLNFSVNTTLNATGNSHAYNIDSLVVGRTYIHSVLVTKNVTFTLTGATKGAVGYYGNRAWVVFTATATTVGVTVAGSSVNVSKPLTEAGSIPRDYFDGSFGPDYLWEQGGVAPNTRSYYYEDRNDRHYVLVRTLQENVPVGVPVASPEYASGPPTS